MNIDKPDRGTREQEKPTFVEVVFFEAGVISVEEPAAGIQRIWFRHAA